MEKREKNAAKNSKRVVVQHIHYSLGSTNSHTHTLFSNNNIRDLYSRFIYHESAVPHHCMCVHDSQRRQPSKGLPKSLFSGVVLQDEAPTHQRPRFAEAASAVIDISRCTATIFTDIKRKNNHYYRDRL